MKLTPKQRAFCQHYLECGNSTEAYIKAGYKAKGARANAARLIAKDSIKSYIEEQMKEIETERIMSAKEALETITAIARGELEEEVVFSTPSGVVRAKKRADINQRLKALEQILKRYPLSIQKELEEAKQKKLEVETELIQERLKQMKGEGASDFVDIWISAVTEA